MVCLNEVEATLFVPLLGRIYTSKKFPQIFYDAKAIGLESLLPAKLPEKKGQTEYTLLAGAIRSANMDYYIANFLQREPQGIVVELGCGLETTFYRHNNSGRAWYGVDLPEVIDYRRKLLPEVAGERYIAADILQENWLRTIRLEHPVEPLLFTASGLFYYFSREEVAQLLKRLGHYGPAEIVFDTMNYLGYLLIGHYMKQVGHGDTAVYFYVADAKQLANFVGAQLVEEKVYYEGVEKEGLKLSTRLTMWGADLLHVAKMIHFKFG